MRTTPTQPTVTVPAGFSGWWCARCEQACPSLPEEAGSPAKCPHCRKWTAVWVPEAISAECGVRSAEGGDRALRHSAPWERVRPRDERAKALFAHMQAVIETPALNPDLRAIEHEQAIE